MAVVGTLYGDKNGFRAKKIIAVAEFGNKKIKVEPLNKMKHNLPCPLTEILFVTNEGNYLFDCNAVACYLANPFHGSAGRDKFHDSEVLQWIHVADTKIFAPLLSWVIPCLSAYPYNKTYVAEAKEETMQVMHWLNTQLLSKTFLVGERISLADIIMACDVLPAYQHVFDERCRRRYANVTRWFLTIINQPFFKKAIGDVPLCEKPAVFDEKLFNEFLAGSLTVECLVNPDAEVGKKVKSEAKAKPAEAPKKKVEVEEEKVAESDKKDPFAAFPKGKFDMDAFKRVYSNEDTEMKAIPYFWSNFDPDNYSIWFCEYKYPKELEKVFMSCNLITGMFQRLDKMRKNAFASVCLFGEDNNSTISGIWIWRGQELAFKLSEDWQIDYESYDWSKLDPKDEKTKSLVNEYLKWEGMFDGKKFNQGKIFK
ncbi:Elongation factor 1-gamma [Trichinella pseudospiralis]|uniref:eEF-1B gamma n=1 Tax=Trichinella pseudospiralis TaxID=6337 RepID=A0A0V1K1G6_TRIPS|nr:Elongation factor 1-gamma [Trichinella pseudospiralis]KRZ26758.1 Elongation factor 1-gamma [Trichinella pseudospiralis]KRZ41082.1 Elongation factor 1-gamma [Trichinella pseudospiralis]KRZ41083.1 Elongation factor 1-gamma [Trichinella pseudospiralis]